MEMRCPMLNHCFRVCWNGCIRLLRVLTLLICFISARVAQNRLHVVHLQHASRRRSVFLQTVTVIAAGLLAGSAMISSTAPCTEPVLVSVSGSEASSAYDSNCWNIRGSSTVEVRACNSKASIAFKSEFKLQSLPSGALLGSWWGLCRLSSAEAMEVVSCMMRQCKSLTRSARLWPFVGVTGASACEHSATICVSTVSSSTRRFARGHVAGWRHWRTKAI